jgi:quercetin dioxygenase-like cupin family protein
MSRRNSRKRVARRELLQCAALAALIAPAATPCAALGAEAEDIGSDKLFASAEPQKFAWGWIRWMMNAEIDPKAEMTLGVVYIEPHQTNPRHLHPNSAEYLHVVSGSCEHMLGKRWVTLKAGDTLRVPKGAVHQARTKDEPCRSIVVYDTGKRQMTPVAEKR